MSRILTPELSLPRLVAALLLLAAAYGSVRASANDFTLLDLEGQPHSLSDYRGQWVLINYWATWCPPCLKELPELEVFHQRSGGHAVVLGVNMETIEQSRLRAFVESQSLSFPILVASARPPSHDLVGPVDSLPTSYLVAPSGKLVARQVGIITADGLDAFIARYKTPLQANRE